MIKNYVFYIRDICDGEYLIPAVAIYVAHFDWPFVCLMLSSEVTGSSRVVFHGIGPTTKPTFIYGASRMRHCSKLQSWLFSYLSGAWQAEPSRANILGLVQYSVVECGSHSRKWWPCESETLYLAAYGPAWASHYHWARNLDGSGLAETLV